MPRLALPSIFAMACILAASPAQPQPAPPSPTPAQPPAPAPSPQPIPAYPPDGQAYPYAYPYYPYPYTYPYPYPYPGQAGPARIPYEEGQPAPPGYRLKSEPRTGLVIGGAVTLGTVWISTILAASIVDAVRNADREKDEPRDNGAAPLFIPVFGPFIAISTLDAEGPGTTLLVMDGLAQGAGAAMLIAGLTAERKVWVRQVGNVELRLAPVALDKRSLSMGLSGRF
jgi:hypothetical protein